MPVDSTSTSNKGYQNPATADGNVLGQSASDPIAFHGATPVAKQTVTGSAGANAALISLLAALAAKGLIVDSSS
jgi:hypothetical protein